MRAPAPARNRCGLASLGEIPGHALPAPCPAGARAARSSPANALSNEEVAELLCVLCSPRFCDLSPAQIWAILLDEGTYLASISTMYRVLRANGEVKERRAQASDPTRARPELMADRPNICWSWDITKLRGPDRGVWFDCYVAIDIFSRYVVGWMVASTENAELAEEFITKAVTDQGIAKGTLTIHADRGTSMTSKGVAELLSDFNIKRTHSRPHVSKTTRTPRRSTRRSSTARPSPPASAPSRTLGRSASPSSTTTTTSIAILALAYILRHRPTTAPQHRSARNEQRTSTRPTPPILAGSVAGDQRRPSFPPSRGSTTPPSRTTHRRNPEHLSQGP